MFSFQLALLNLLKGLLTLIKILGRKIMHTQWMVGR